MMLRASHKIGVDANRPLIVEGDESGLPSPTVADPALIADTGAGWVRLNFVLGPWSGPEDRTLFQGRDWEGAYRSIVDGLYGKGLSIYGLVGHEAVQEDPGDRFRQPPEEMTAEAIQAAENWIKQYVANFTTIVRRFYARVQIWESFNEPDDWHGADRHWIHPAWFARMLQELYAAVKRDAEIRNAKLVSGPLQGLEINHNGAASYLRATYAEGKRRFGWGQAAPFPFDGVGYHLYIHEGRNDNWVDQEQKVRRTYREYVDGMLQVIREAEGREKPLYISEIGWFSNGGLEQFQADNMRLGLELAANDPAVALAIWFCMQDFGGEADGKYYGLYRKGALTPENRKPAYFVYKTFMQSALALPQVQFTNQTMINAFYLAAQRLGLAGWQLLSKAGLGHLVYARQDTYTGPEVEQLTALSDQERAAVKQALSELVPELKREVGTTTGYLNLRAGPGTENAILAVLPPKTEVEILGRVDNWLHVAALGKVGYVHRNFVTLEGQRAPLGFLRTWEKLDAVPLAPPDAEKLAVDAAADWTERTLADVWNRYGGLLAVIANELKVDPAVAVAVFTIESPGGKCFGDDGRMIIRFENHVFYDRWGASNSSLFAERFRFDPTERWKGHQWRRSAQEPWRDLHTGQASEWEAFEFARTLDDTAAKLSISMGAPQIMGFHYATIGYESVQQMFDAFASDARAQIIGFFDFVKGPDADSPRLRALQELDLDAFASLYNGSGQAELYSSRLKAAFESFKRMRAAEPTAPRAPERPVALPMPEGEAPWGLAEAAAPQAVEAPALASPPPEAARVDLSAWQRLAQQAVEQNEAAFRRLLEALTAWQRWAVWPWRALLVVGVVSFLAALGMAFGLRELWLSLVFAGLSVIALPVSVLIALLRRPAAELTLLTWLRVVADTYWAHLMYVAPGPSAQAALTEASKSAVDEIQRILDKLAQLGK